MKYHFSDEERYAVYTVHGEKCYLNGEPLDLLTMEVDHVIPESLSDDPPKLQEVLAGFGLPKDFDLQSYANWLPACRPCNLKKREIVFQPSPLIQLHLQKAAAKAVRAAQLAASRITNRSLAKAWSVIKRGDAKGELSEDLRQAIEDFSSFHAQQRAPEAAHQPLHLTPLIEVLSEGESFRIVKGPYGIGGGPIHPSVGSNFRCGVCGGTDWNGARCVLCGHLNDD
jgi:5-methylcytosine-specific restriction endonuclease McrA